MGGGGGWVGEVSSAVQELRESRGFGAGGGGGGGGGGSKTVDAYALYVSVPILPVIEENRIPDCLETAKSPRITTVRARHCITYWAGKFTVHAFTPHHEQNETQVATQSFRRLRRDFQRLMIKLHVIDLYFCVSAASYAI